MFSRGYRDTRLQGRVRREEPCSQLRVTVYKLAKYIRANICCMYFKKKCFLEELCNTNVVLIYILYIFYHASFAAGNFADKSKC